jgi:hypothetical protein
MKRVSTSVVLRGSVERFISYWFYDAGFHAVYKDMYCSEENDLCPSSFRTDSLWIKISRQMCGIMSREAGGGELMMKQSMMALMRTDAFSFLMHMPITAKVFGGVYGEPEAYVPAEGRTLVITNGNPRKGRTPEEYTHWQLDRLSGFVEYDAGLVDFAKHLLVHRCVMRGGGVCMCGGNSSLFCFIILITFITMYNNQRTHRFHDVLTVEDIRETLSVDEAWLTDSGRTYWQR